MNFIISLLKGIAIGAGAILPGISSGVICVICGIYEKLLDCILNFFKNIKHNFKVLLPFVIGISIGIILFGNILKYLFFAYPLQIKFCFIGLILGSIPSLIKQSNIITNFRISYIICFILSTIIATALIIAENKFSFNGSKTNFDFFYLILCGILMSAGVIIPGISSTLILMLLGVYNAYLLSVSCIYIPFLFPLCIGLSIGCIIFMKITKFLLSKFHTQTFLSIIGFTIGSIFILYPGLTLDINGIIGILSLLLGLGISSFF